MTDTAPLANAENLIHIGEQYTVDIADVHTPLIIGADRAREGDFFMNGYANALKDALRTAAREIAALRACAAANTPAPCEMTHTEPLDFAQCSTRENVENDLVDALSAGADLSDVTDTTIKLDVALKAAKSVVTKHLRAQED